MYVDGVNLERRKSRGVKMGEREKEKKRVRI